MYQILISCALPQELAVVRKKIKTLNIPGLKIDFLQTWMWNYNTIFALTKKLGQKQYDFIMNIGVSGLRRMTEDIFWCWENNLITDNQHKITDDSQAKLGTAEGSKSLWLEQDNLWLSNKNQSLKIFISPFYQVSNIFELETWKELIVPVFFKFWPLSSCISANKAIKDEDLDGFKDRIGIDNNNFDWWGNNRGWWWSERTTESNFLPISSELSSDFSFLLDMESYGFEFVLEKYNLPRIILKVPVDTNDGELENFDYQKALNLLWENIDYEQLLLETKKYLDNTKKESLNLEKYFQQLPFSQRQKEIFEFLYRKYSVVVWWDFDKFFSDFLQNNEDNKNKKQVIWKLFVEMEKLFDEVVN